MFSEFSYDQTLKTLIRYSPSYDALCFFTDIPKHELDLIFTKYDLRRLDLYSRNMVDYHLIMDLIPEGQL